MTNDREPTMGAPDPPTLAADDLSILQHIESHPAALDYVDDVRLSALIASGHLVVVVATGIEITSLGRAVLAANKKK